MKTPQKRITIFTKSLYEAGSPDFHPNADTLKRLFTFPPSVYIRNKPFNNFFLQLTYSKYPIEMGDDIFTRKEASSLLSSLSAAPVGSARVAVVEKEWFDSFVAWLQNPDANPRPQNARIDSLCAGDRFRPSLVLHRDYEVVPMAMWGMISRVFRELPKAERTFVVNPQTGDCTVILNEEIIRISFRSAFYRLLVDKEWALSDVRKYFCAVIGFTPKNVQFFSVMSHSLLEDNMIVGSVMHDYDGSVELSEYDVDECEEEKTENKSCFEIEPNFDNYLGCEVPNKDANTRISGTKDASSFINIDRIKSKTKGSGYDDVSVYPLEEPEQNKLNDPSILEFLSLHTTSPFPKPAGLYNLGNTCFFNAAVQCLIRVQPLTAYMMSPSFEKQLNVNNPLGSRGEIAMAYRNFLMDICSGTTKPRNPRNLKNAIGSKYRIFANYSQQDPQELLNSLLDGIHEDLNQSSKAKGNLPEKHLPPDPDPWLVHISRNSSPIVELFHGVLYNSIKCDECGYVHKSHEPFMFLTLPIPKQIDGSVQLKDCIASFSKSERLDENNKWICEKCKNPVRATKSIGIEKCPPLLIIHLKRFNRTYNRLSKIRTSVDYPDIIDVSEFTLSEQKKKYQLIGVVYHSGELNGGHCTSAAFDLPTNTWYYFNDSSVSEMSLSQVHNSKAYILFYQEFE